MNNTHGPVRSLTDSRLGWLLPLVLLLSPLLLPLLLLGLLRLPHRSFRTPANRRSACAFETQRNSQSESDADTIPTPTDGGGRPTSVRRPFLPDRITSESFNQPHIIHTHTHTKTHGRGMLSNTNKKNHSHKFIHAMPSSRLPDCAHLGRVLRPFRWRYS